MRREIPGAVQDGLRKREHLLCLPSAGREELPGVIGGFERVEHSRELHQAGRRAVEVLGLDTDRRRGARRIRSIELRACLEIDNANTQLVGNRRLQAEVCDWWDTCSRGNA